MSTLSLTTPSTVALAQAGQSPWLDFISREILRNGKLKSFIEDFGLLGVTSNPSIFEKSITQPGGGYEKDIRKWIKQGISTFDIYDALTISDIQQACDLFKSVYKKTHGEHGFVSLEVSPALAHYPDETLKEAQRLFKAVNRPNVMIKIPATSECIPVVAELLGQGININITLMFSLHHYQQVANAYLEGLTKYKAKGGDISRVHSVASVFVSRIDTLIDKRLQVMLGQEKSPERQAEIESLLGKAAVANSKIIYREFKKIFGSEKFHALRTQGANIQKVLWGSTSTKNPNYPDLLYVEPLIGDETVNTMPLPTLEAFIDHGRVRGKTINEDYAHAADTEDRLNALGFDLNAVGEELQKEGVKAFNDSFESLMRTLEKMRFDLKPSGKSKDAFFFKVDSKTSQKQSIAAEIKAFQENDFLKRFFQKDASLWKKDPQNQKSISNRLGWLQVTDWMLGRLHELDQLAEEIRRDGIQDIILLGMGGSSLAPEVMDLIFKKAQIKRIRFHVLDTTDASSISACEKAVNLSSALFIVASKSGGTIETLSQFRYFFDKVEKKTGKSRAKGQQNAGRSFVAITDEGSFLQKLAQEKKFRRIFINPSNIGGRYSALSLFGMVPAALIGLPFRDILKSAREFLRLTQKENQLAKNPGIFLGILLGLYAKEGKDKVTFWMSESLKSFGAWLEQLIAESTGKEGKGIIPIDGEGPESAAVYKQDRVFVVLKLKGDPAAALTGKIQAVKKTGFPVIELEWSDPRDMGAAFLNWEIATSLASAVLGVNPFDELNVTESKDNTARLLAQFEKQGKLAEPKTLLKMTDNQKKFSAAFQKFFSKIKEGGYIALLSYTKRSPQTAKSLNRIRKQLAQIFKVPVLVGFGPRYLHSIGQLYKGGPKSGAFIEFLSEEGPELRIPGMRYSFAQLIKAQAWGDLEALEKKGLPVLPVSLGKNTLPALAGFEKQLASYFKDHF